MTWILAQSTQLLACFMSMRLSLKALKKWTSDDINKGTKRQQQDDLKKASEVLKFWALFGFFQIFDNFIEFSFRWIPMYYYGKAFLYMALAFPETKVAHLIFNDVLVPFLERLHGGDMKMSNHHILTPLDMVLLGLASILLLLFPGIAEHKVLRAKTRQRIDRPDGVLMHQPWDPPSDKYYRQISSGNTSSLQLRRRPTSENLARTAKRVSVVPVDTTNTKTNAAAVSFTTPDILETADEVPVEFQSIKLSKKKSARRISMICHSFREASQGTSDVAPPSFTTPVVSERKGLALPPATHTHTPNLGAMPTAMTNSRYFSCDSDDDEDDVNGKLKNAAVPVVPSPSISEVNSAVDAKEDIEQLSTIKTGMSPELCTPPRRKSKAVRRLSTMLNMNKIDMSESSPCTDNVAHQYLKSPTVAPTTTTELRTRPAVSSGGLVDSIQTDSDDDELAGDSINTDAECSTKSPSKSIFSSLGLSKLVNLDLYSPPANSVQRRKTIMKMKRHSLVGATGVSSGLKQE